MIMMNSESNPHYFLTFFNWLSRKMKLVFKYKCPNRKLSYKLFLKTINPFYTLFLVMYQLELHWSGLNILFINLVRELGLK